MLLAAGNDWILGGVIGAGITAVCGVLAKILDIRLFRAKDESDFRREMITEINKLRGQIEHQDGIIAWLQGQVNKFNSLVAMQRILKHEWKNRFNAARLIITLYRKTYGQHVGDVLEWEEAIEDAEDDLLCEVAQDESSGSDGGGAGLSTPGPTPTHPGEPK